jgi:hypothetical protein
MVWAVGPIYGYSAYGVVEAQAILKNDSNERDLFSEFGLGQADNVLEMSTVGRKRSCGNDWIAVILRVSPWVTLLTRSSILQLLAHVVHTCAILSNAIPK